MNERGFFRFGAGAAMAGSVIALVFNLLHPRTKGGLTNPQAHLRDAAASDIWLLDHVMLAIAVLLTTIGLFAVGRSLLARAESSWTWIFLFSLAISTATIYTLLVIDTWPLKEAASAGGPVGEALVRVASGLLIGVTGAHFGVTPLLLGIALLATPFYPRGVAYLALAGGVMGFIGAVFMSFQGPTEAGIIGFFTVASLLLTVTTFWAGWHLWQSHATVETSARTVTRTERPVTPGL